MKIKAINGRYVKVILFLIVLLALLEILAYKETNRIDMNAVVVFAILISLVLVVKYLHVYLLKRKAKQFIELEKGIGEQIRALNSKFGAKVQNSLKNSLCRDKIIAKQNVPSHVCTKK